MAAAAAIPLAAGARGETAAKALPFRLDEVRLLDGPFRRGMESNREFLHSLEPGRLLHTFRKTAGLPSTAEPLGGWERPDCELRGHFTGHFLTACALMSASAADTELRDKAMGIAGELARCQKANGGGYLSAFPPEFFERLKAGKSVWAPWYTIHKILAGLLDVHHLCGDKDALRTAEEMAGWVMEWAKPLSDEHMARTLNVEFGGMNEILFNLHAATGNPDWAKLARRFEHHRVFDPLAAGRDELKGLHVNTQIPKIIGAARGFELESDVRYRRIAEYFWEQVTQHRAYCTGGTSNDEHWRTPPDQLAAELSAVTQECCCTYNLLKLTRHLFGWTAGPRYAEYYERALFNGILGTIDPATGLTMYFVPLAPGYWKTFATPRHSFWCCTGTGAESFSKLGDSIYFRENAGLYVNLFVASELKWRDKGVRVRQETRFPEEEATSLAFTVQKPLRFTVRIRVPEWVSGAAALKINGKPDPTPARPGTHCAIDRVWKTGDRIEFRTPMNLRAHAMPDDPGLQAFEYGPLVLAGDLGTEGIAEQMKHAVPGEPSLDQRKWAKPAPAPELVARDAEPGRWIQPGGQPLTFRTSGQTQNVTLLPLNRVLEQRYGVYWRVRRA